MSAHEEALVPLIPEDETPIETLSFRQAWKMAGIGCQRFCALVDDGCIRVVKGESQDRRNWRYVRSDDLTVRSLSNGE